MIKSLYQNTTPYFFFFVLVFTGCLRSPNFNNPLEKDALRLEAGNYIVKVHIQGMLVGNTLGLQLNNHETISAQGNGIYSFQTYLKEGNAYNVTIFSPSYRQNCTLEPASGTIEKTDVQIEVTCVTVLFLVGGSVNTYAGPNSSVQLQINGGEYLFVSQGQTFWFHSTLLNDGDTYNVVVTMQPFGGLCNVVNGSDTINNADVGNVEIQCIPWGYDLISVTPSSQTIIGKTQPIVLVANKSLDPANCEVDTVLNGSMINFTPSNATFTFSTTYQTNDTLTIAPTANWETGSSRLLSINNCYAVGGEPYIQYGYIYLSYIVVNDPNRIRYVSPTGNDTNNGLTPATAQKLVGHAYNQLVTSYATECATDKDCYVLVTTGNHPVYTPITMQSGISILGAFNSSFTERQAWNDSWRSVLDGSSIAAANCGPMNTYTPCATIISPYPLAHPETQLSGLRVIGPNVDHSAAIRLMGAMPYLMDSIFLGGNCNASICSTSGIYIQNVAGYSTLLFWYLETRGGDCQGINCTTSGLVYDANAPAVNIDNLTARGGNSTSPGSYSRGILLRSNAHNQVKINNSWIGAGSAHFTAGLHAVSSNPLSILLLNSDITGGYGNDNHSGILVSNTMPSGALSIENSIIHGGNLGPAAVAGAYSAAVRLLNHNFNYTISHSLLFAGQAGVAGTSAVVQIHAALINPINIFYSNLIGGAGLKRYGINFASSGWVAGSDISYNNFFNTPDAFIALSAATTLLTVIQPTHIATADLSSSVPAPNNRNVAPHFANPNANPPDFQYTAATSCSLTQAADSSKSGVILFSTDKNGSARPSSNSTRSIGPYQWNGTCVP